MRTKLVYLFVIIQIAFLSFAITGSAQTEKNHHNSKVPPETLERKLIYKLYDKPFSDVKFVNENYCIGWYSGYSQILFIDLKKNITKEYQCDEPMWPPSMEVSPDKKTCAIIDEVEYESNGVSQIKYVLYVVDVETSAVTKYEYPEFFDITAKAPHYKYDNPYAKKGEKITNYPFKIFWPNSKEIYIYGLSMWGIDLSTGKAAHLIDDDYLEKCQEQTDWMFRYGVEINFAIQGNVIFFHHDGVWKERDERISDELVFTTDGRSYPLPDAGVVQGIYKDRYILFENFREETSESSIYDFNKKKFLETDGCSIFFSDKFVVALNAEKKKIYIHDGKKTRESNVPELDLIEGWKYQVHTDSIFLYYTDEKTKERIDCRYDLNSQQLSEVEESDIDFYNGGIWYASGPTEWIDCEDGKTRRIYNDDTQEFYDLSWKR